MNVSKDEMGLVGKSSVTTTNAVVPVVAAISATTTIPSNPSTTLTGDATAVLTSTTKPDHHVYNATGYLTEPDELDHSILAAFSDIQTVFLACISTLLPLIIALGIAFAIRHVWRKYRSRRDSSSGLPWYRGICSRDNASDSLRNRQRSGSTTIQAATQILSAQDLVNVLDGPRYICETEVMDEVSVAAATAPIIDYVNAPTEFASSGNHTSKNSNGNIITLTLKNNHLIVETEERAVTMEETKHRKYQNNECSFVVEVQPSYQKPVSGSADDVNGGVTDQQALVHREEISDDRSSGFENARLFGSTNTGLSQSDLSISSQDSVNPSYRYGNQVEYDTGHLGYPMYGGSYESDALSRKLEGSSKWVEFDKSPDTEKTLFYESKSSSLEKDQDDMLILDASRNPEGSSIEYQDSTEDASNSTETIRSNPNLQINGTTPNKLVIMEKKAMSLDAPKIIASHYEFNKMTSMDSNKPIITGALLKEDLQEDTFQEQQRKLGNGTLTPEYRNNKTKEAQIKAEGSVFAPCHKRTGSIPPRLIEENVDLERKKSLDIYSQIKTSTKSILPSLNPKFELLQNEVSPIEEKES